MTFFFSQLYTCLYSVDAMNNERDLSKSASRSGQLTLFKFLRSCSFQSADVGACDISGDRHGLKNSSMIYTESKSHSDT
jgi:hypothetical protein